MINKIYFKNVSDLYPICQKGGFKGSLENFMTLNIGQVFAYINIVRSGDYTEH
jgi:hypothetical protein